MKRMKTLLPIVLLALLVVIMSSGSVAIYTQTQTLRGQLYTRIFLFAGAEKATSYEFGLSGLRLSPGQSEQELYRFTLTNAQNGNVSDYGMTVSISSSGMANAISAMGGLTFYLYDINDEGGAPVASISSGELAVGSLHFTANVSKTMEYRLTARWTDNGNAAEQTAVARSAQQYPIQIRVTAQADN